MSDNKNLYIENFIIRLLEKKRNIPKKVKKNMQNFNYLDQGQIDSLGLMSFIFSIEKKFKFKFTPKELSSKEFRVFTGLINLIKKKINL